ncbi:MAG: hypothetical protein ACPGUV_01885 [Polyangiales bacterium]
MATKGGSEKSGKLASDSDATLSLAARYQQQVSMYCSAVQGLESKVWSEREKLCGDYQKEQRAARERSVELSHRSYDAYREYASEMQAARTSCDRVQGQARASAACEKYRAAMDKVASEYSDVGNAMQKASSHYHKEVSEIWRSVMAGNQREQYRDVLQSFVSGLQSLLASPQLHMESMATVALIQQSLTSALSRQASLHAC